MMDWLADHAWMVWMGVGMLLAVTELTILDFTLLMLAAGAVAGGLVALALPGLVWLQVVVALVVAVAMLWVIRPALQRRMHPKGELKTGTANLVGRSGTVVKAIDTDAGGAIRIGGELWSARPFHDEPIPEGVRVEVLEIDGATALVYPADQPIGGLGELDR